MMMSRETKLALELPPSGEMLMDLELQPLDSMSEAALKEIRLVHPLT